MGNDTIHDEKKLARGHLREVFSKSGHSGYRIPHELEVIGKRLRPGARKINGSAYKTVTRETSALDHEKGLRMYEARSFFYAIKNPTKYIAFIKALELKRQEEEKEEEEKQQPKDEKQDQIPEEKHTEDQGSQPNSDDAKEGAPEKEPHIDSSSDAKPSRKTDSLSESLEELYKELPPLEKLPAPLIEFIDEIKDLTDLEKITKIHSFVSKNMEYNHLEAKTEQGLSTNYKDVTENWITGDCDNYATLQAALLQYSGIEPSNIYWVGANVTYDDSENFEPHAFLIVDHKDDLLVLDMNLQKPELLREDLKTDGLEMRPWSFAQLGGKKYIVIISDTLIDDSIDHFINEHSVNGPETMRP